MSVTGEGWGMGARILSGMIGKGFDLVSYGSHPEPFCHSEPVGRRISPSVTRETLRCAQSDK